MDEIDRKILSETQAGLPLVASPYGEIGKKLGLDEGEVITRMAAMQQDGIIRRIAIAPNHYALGWVANGMSVWDVEDDLAEELGEKTGQLPFVSHCYLRPRKLPIWPYNLFAMIHGRDRQAVEAHRSEISAILGGACRQNDILYSTRILKKTGMRLKKGG